MSGYGVDVAADRMDDLDRRVLAVVSDCRRDGFTPIVLDGGCGSGGLARRLAGLGASVTAVDIVDHNAHFTAFTNTGSTFTQADVVDFIASTSGRYDLVVLQRLLHHLPYPKARTLLTTLATRNNFALYVAVSGLRSQLGQFYQAHDQPVANRWQPLTPEGQTLFAMNKAVCLYSALELRALLTSCGWEVVELWSSTFGNHKAVATPTNK